MVSAGGHFTAAEIERSRSYHRPLYAALVVDLALALGTLAALAFDWPGDRLYTVVDGLPWWASALSFTGLVVGCTIVVRLPLAFWRGYVYEHRFGLSTQGPLGWLGDRARGLAVGVTMSSLTILGLVGLARLLPGAWPAAAAPAAATLTVLLSFGAPVLLEPIFNRFEPLADDRLVADLRTLAVRAGVPIREVLVADASRRTRKKNAYVSGLGRTRRVVLYDTLLAGGDRRELRLVTAHELAHRRERHVAKGTALAAAGAAAAVLILWSLLSSTSVLEAIGATGAGDPRVAPFVRLTGSMLELVSLPLVSALSRRWERAADRASLELTGDLDAFESAHRRLARSNLSDLDPPRVLYLALFTHPTPPERLEHARRLSMGEPMVPPRTLLDS